MPGRRIESSIGLLAIHSQSNRADAPLNFNDPEEQAFDSRALTLPNIDIVATSTPIEPAYKNYLRLVLKVPLPKVITPSVTEESLSASIMQDESTLQEIKDTQEIARRPFVLSVFDPTDSERQLLNTLRQKGIDVIPEVNFDVAARLGNKAGFREFCEKHGIPQVSGGVFSTTEDLQGFIARSQHRRRGILLRRPDPVGVVLKHPNGTAGEGIDILNAGDSSTEEQRTKWESWIQKVGAVVGEEKHRIGQGFEHALHIYIDPVTKEARVTGVYDQLTKENEHGGQSHYGAIAPMEDKHVRNQLVRLAKRKIIPALLQEGYTGPACFDVLSQPMHFMELNTRAGANYYAHREVEQVAQSIYKQQDIRNTPFMFLSNLDAPQGEKSFAEFYHNHWEALQPKENGTLILTNPSRHKFGHYDLVAYSPKGIEEAEKILREGLINIWGADKAEDILSKIHQKE